MQVTIDGGKVQPAVNPVLQEITEHQETDEVQQNGEYTC